LDYAEIALERAALAQKEDSSVAGFLPAKSNDFQADGL